MVGVARDNIEKAKKSIADMASKDMSMAIQSKSRVDQMMGQISNFNEEVAESLQKVSVLADGINNNVANAVRSLQFEDIAGQLVIQAGDNLERLDEYHLGVSDALAHSEHHDVTHRLEAARDFVRQKQAKREDVVRKPVGQDSMDEGEIELF